VQGQGGAAAEPSGGPPAASSLGALFSAKLEAAQASSAAAAAAGGPSQTGQQGGPQGPGPGVAASQRPPAEFPMHAEVVAVRASQRPSLPSADRILQLPHPDICVKLPWAGAYTQRMPECNFLP